MYDPQEFKGKTGQWELEKEIILAFELLSNGIEDLLQINGLKTLSSQVLSKKFLGCVSSVLFSKNKSPHSNEKLLLNSNKCNLLLLNIFSVLGPIFYNNSGIK